MKNERASLASILWASAIRVYGPIGVVAGIAFTILAWLKTPDASIQLWVAVLSASALVLTVTILFDSVIQLSNASLDVRPSKIISVQRLTVDGRDQLVLAFQPSSAFALNSFVTFFRIHNGMEIDVGWGYVSRLQEDGRMQAIFSQVASGSDDLVRELYANKHDAIAGISVKHFVTRNEAFRAEVLPPVALAVDAANQLIAPAAPPGGGDALTKEADSEGWFELLNQRKLDEARQAFLTRNSASTSDVAEKQREEAFFWAMYLKYDVSKAVTELQKLMSDTYAQSSAHFFLGVHYARNAQFDLARSEFESALTSPHGDWPNKEAIVSELAKLDLQQGRGEEGRVRLMKHLHQIESEGTSAEARVATLEALASLFKESNQAVPRMLALFLARESSAHSSNVDFDSAFVASDIGYIKLSSYLYDVQLRSDGANWSVWNNLGVAFSRLDCPITSVTYFAKAADKGETLAVANLALDYLNAGFADEALSILDSVSAKENVHANVAHNRSVITKRRETEREQKEAVLEEGKKQHLFFVDFAKSYFAAQLPVAAGSDWIDDSGLHYQLSQTAGQIHLEWRDGLSKYRLHGQLRGRAALVQLDRESYSEWQKSSAGFLFVSQSLGSIEILYGEPSDSYLKRLKPGLKLMDIQTALLNSIAAENAK